MANSIEIQSQVLTDTAQKVETINGNMDTQLQEVLNSMNALDATWQSDASRDIIANINALKPRIEEYKGVVASYVTFLRNTAQNYETTEQTVQNNASAFK